MMLVYLLLFLCVGLIVVYLRKDRNYWRKRNVFQIDGSLRTFIFGTRSLPEMFKEYYEKYPKEKYIGVFLGASPAVILRDAEDITFVLQTGFQNFHSRGFTTNPTDLLADNLLFMNNYPRWKLVRQKVTPVFTQMKLKNMFYIIEKCARDFVVFVKENDKMREKPFNALYTYTTASIGASVFGIDTHTKNTMDSPFIEMSWKIFEPTLWANLKFVISNYSPTLFLLLNLKSFGEFEEFFIGVVKKVLETRRRTKEVRHDFIDMCLELQQSGVLQDPKTGYEVEPTDELLAAQAFFFFVAGADPTASAMHYALLELSNNPSVLKRLHQEIDSTFEKCNETLTYTDVENMVYLDMVINESMRKYPTIGFIQRKCFTDTVLPSGQKIEKNAIALIPVFALHRDERYFPKPKVFDPERFAPENASNIVKNTYLPFGGGNRVCIGTRLARLQVKLGLASLLRKFTLREQNYEIQSFENSSFGLRDVKATYELLDRDTH